MLQRPLHSVKCTARVAISKHGIIRLFWFQNVDEETVTVTKEHYIDVLKKSLRALGTHRGVNQDVQWFQQDGATLHTAKITMEWLHHRIPNRLISKRWDLEGSLHSPNLNRPDFHLCGFLKDNVNENNPQSIAELKIVINQKICVILKKKNIMVTDNLARRIRVYHQRNEGHLEHVQ